MEELFFKQVQSTSDLNLSGRGSFRHFDKTDYDYQLIRQGSNTSLTRKQLAVQIPPQPLRPAPVPPLIGQLQLQSSQDSSVFGSNSSSPLYFDKSFPQLPKIPPPPQPSAVNGRSGSPATETHNGPTTNKTSHAATNTGLSATNPFLPLLQASSQFFSQTIQSLQTFQQQKTHHEGPPSSYPTDELTSVGNVSNHNHSNVGTKAESERYSSSSSVPNCATGLSMGELLFSAAPAYQSSTASTSSIGSQQEDFSLGTQQGFLASQLAGQFRTENKVEYRMKEADDVPAKTSNGITSQDYGLRSTNNRCTVNKNSLSSQPEEGRRLYSVSKSESAAMATNDEHRTVNKYGDPVVIESRRRRKMSDEFIKGPILNAQAKIPSTENGQEILDKNDGYQSKVDSNSTPRVGNDEIDCTTMGTTGGSDGTEEVHIRRNSLKEIFSGSNSNVADSKERASAVVLVKESEEVQNMKMLETMREEIRLANEQMTDATKSLMMDEDEAFMCKKSAREDWKSISQNKLDSFSQYLGRSFEKSGSRSTAATTDNNGRIQDGITNGEHHYPPSTKNNMPTAGIVSTSNTKSNNYSSPEKLRTWTSTGGYGANRPRLSSAKGTHSLDLDLNSTGRIGRDAIMKLLQSSPLPPVTNRKPMDHRRSSSTDSTNGTHSVSNTLKNLRSFSLRQSSVDSINSDISDLTSPIDNSNLQRAMSCDSVCSDTSVILGDLDSPHVTGFLCVGLEYDRYVPTESIMSHMRIQFVGCTAPGKKTENNRYFSKNEKE